MASFSQRRGAVQSGVIIIDRYPEADLGAGGLFVARQAPDMAVSSGLLPRDGAQPAGKAEWREENAAQPCEAPWNLFGDGPEEHNERLRLALVLTCVCFCFIHIFFFLFLPLRQFIPNEQEAVCELVYRKKRSVKEVYSNFTE